MNEILLEPIGKLRTCFPEKLGIPRQPGLAPLARGVLEFSTRQPPAVWRDALRGLESFSHVWLTFVFDQAVPQGWKARIRPPRLDGKEKMGVFATRSPHRPNFLGLSLCRLERIDFERPCVHLAGVDLLDRTPIVDLRPFHCENDVVHGELRRGWIERACEPGLPVQWCAGVADKVQDLLWNAQGAGLPEYTPDEAVQLVEQLVGLDPRPAHRRGQDGQWYMRVLNFDVRVQVERGTAQITDLRP